MSADMRQPVVSVCVVAYNHHAYIESCLLSVLAQSGNIQIEILVGDDASTDNTAELVQTLATAHPNVITLYRHTPNIGAAQNYQFLVERASGLYIAHLDGDDYWLPDKLLRQLRHFSAHPDCAAVYANAIAIAPSGELFGSFSNNQPDTFGAEYLLEKGNFLHHSSLLYRSHLKASVLSIQGPFIDYQIHLGLARHGPLGFVNAVSTAYRTGHPGSATVATPKLIDDLYWQALLQGLRHASTASARTAKRRFWARTLVRQVLAGTLRGGLDAVKMIRRDAGTFDVVDIAYGVVYAIGDLLDLVSARVSRLIYRSRVRLLIRR